MLALGQRSTAFESPLQSASVRSVFRVLKEEKSEHGGSLDGKNARTGHNGFLKAVVTCVCQSRYGKGFNKPIPAA